MLTLTRKPGESIMIGDEIEVFVKEIKGKQIRIGIRAPRDLFVCRKELYEQIQRQNQEAAEANAADLDLDALIFSK